MSSILTEEERVQALKENLYYDLLEKYIAIKQELIYSNERIHLLKNEVLAFREHQGDTSRTVASHNAMIDSILGILYRNKSNYQKAITEIKLLYLTI